MNQQSTTAGSSNGASTPHDLFVLTDEQILEIEPEGEVYVAPGLPAQAGEPRDGDNIFESSKSSNARQDSSVASLPRHDEMEENDPSAIERGLRDTGHEAQPGVAVLQEPPPWLAAQMKDPWSGEEAKELWNGVLQARSEAAAYRAAFATPEDARALKDLYPGGVNEARSAVTRARLLDEIDRSFFGATGATPEQTSAGRAQLAALMLREDPGAFREMVFAGLRALEEAEKGSSATENASSLPRLAQVLTSRNDVNVAQPFRAASSVTAAQASNQDAGMKPAHSQALHEAPVASHESPVSGYAAFERAANEDLERSVGTAITHTILQALPNLGKDEGKAGTSWRCCAPRRRSRPQRRSPTRRANRANSVGAAFRQRNARASRPPD